jgi:hypothetical protein
MQQTIATRYKLRDKGVEMLTREHWEDMDCEWEVIAWWERYMRDVKFRYDQELAAHIEEYRRASEIAVNRRQRQYALKDIAHKLASPLYGKMVTPGKAKQLLKAA